MDWEAEEAELKHRDREALAAICLDVATELVFRAVPSFSNTAAASSWRVQAMACLSYSLLDSIMVDGVRARVAVISATLG